MVAGTRRCAAMHSARSFFLYSEMPVEGRPASTEKEGARRFSVSGTGLGGDTPREEEL